jgi:hypothetical protein
LHQSIRRIISVAGLALGRVRAARCLAQQVAVVIVAVVLGDAVVVGAGGDQLVGRIIGVGGADRIR